MNELKVQVAVRHLFEFCELPSATRPVSSFILYQYRFIFDKNFLLGNNNW